MIPIRLEMKNYMAYRDAPAIDFTGLHLVCLTGDNGAGKSTLLDAITWALWGEARAKKDDELIHQGENEMRVALTFKESGNVYQVVRSRKVGRPTARNRAPASTGSLDLLIEDNGSWRTLNEVRQLDTQAKIIRILSLTYDTFVNSAFLKQGRADEFTLKTPGERKALLAEILNLQQWTDYEEQVKAQQTELERNRNLVQYELDAAEAEIARLPQYEQELEAATKLGGDADIALIQVEQEMAELERQRERGRAIRSSITQQEDRMRTVQRERDETQKQMLEHRRVLEDYRLALQQRDTILRGVADYQDAAQRNDEMNGKLVSLVGLNERKAAAEQVIAEAKRSLITEREVLQQQLRGLTLQADSQTLQTQLSAIEVEYETLSKLQLEREEHAALFGTHREKQGELKRDNEQKRRDMNDLKARIVALSKVGAICPTCGRELHEEDRTRLLNEWQEQGKRWAEMYRAAEDQHKQLLAAGALLDTQIADADRSLKRLPGVNRELAALEERVSRTQQAAAQIPAVQASLDRVEQLLAAQAYAQDEQTQLSIVMQELAALGYDHAAHRQLQQQLNDLKVYVERKQQLDKAESGIGTETRALSLLELSEQRQSEQQVAVEAQVNSQRADLSAIEHTLLRSAAVEGALQRARVDSFTAQRKVGEATQRVQSCRALEGTRNRRKQELEALAKRQGLLAELRIAFGKNGVPAMIIESILPELESSANVLLDRMSNGRMTVRFETQRQTQRGDVSETLEIRINDELGERPYEMFSGGEAFRINFAIRVALSKLLANRAGARLQTLFTDEGFGTQDTSGRERLVEAIQSIQDEFELIIVITHIDELKDHFPARIEVTKHSTGSAAQLV